MILNSPYISGSLTVTGNTTIQGQLTVTGSLSGTASLASNALLLQGTGSTGFATTASINEVSASQQSISASLLQVSASYIALSGSYNTFSGSASTRITANSSSIQQVSASQQQISASLLQVSASYTALSGSYTTFSGSNSTILTAVSSSQQQISSSYIALSASYNTFSGSASTRTTQIEQVYATTGSNSFRANQSITGSLVVSSTITAQTLIVQTVTSSIVYSSGSNVFGCDLNSRQTFTGSVLVTGSLTIAGPMVGSSTACFSGQICAPTVVASTCLAVRAGNARLVANNIAGAASNDHFAMQRNDAQYASIGLNGSDNFTIFGTSTSCPRLTIDGSGIASFTSQICTVAIVTGDLRYTGTGYITYDTSASGTSCLIIRQNATERMRISECGYVAVTGNQALSCVPYLQGMSFGWNRSNGQGESMINWTNAGGGNTCDLTFNFRDSSTLYERLRIASTGTATFSGNVNVTVANTPEVLLTHSNTSKTFLMAVDGSNAFFRANSTNNILFQYGGGTNALSINGSNGAACFSSTVCAGAGLTANTLTISCNSGDDRAMYMALNCSANYNSGADNTIARSVNSLKFLWYNNCWEIGATRGGDTAIQALVFAKNGNTYLAMNCNGLSCFACPTSISRAYNASYGSLQVGGIVDSFSDNAVFRVWNAAASFAGGSGTDAWAFSGNNTDYAVYGANDLYLYSGGIRRLQFTGGGVACFRCTICAPLFKGGSFSTSTCTFAATSAGTNYDITGPGSGRWLASVGTNAVYHWNGVLALTFFDSADFGVNILTCGSYATAASISIVNSGSSLRFCFNRDVGTVTVNYLSL